MEQKETILDGESESGIQPMTRTALLLGLFNLLIVGVIIVVDYRLERALTDVSTIDQHRWVKVIGIVSGFLLSVVGVFMGAQALKQGKNASAKMAFWINLILMLLYALPAYTIVRVVLGG